MFLFEHSKFRRSNCSIMVSLFGSNFLMEKYHTHFSTFVAMRWKNFGKIFVLIQLNPECREQAAGSKLLHKYFSDKNFQMAVICREKINRLVSI